MGKILGVSVISSKGTVTIPKKVREILKLSRGDLVVFKLSDDGNIIIKKGDDVE
ncbi:MAG TPA: AbrB/MazE/SpoVT family DNA-binding domain-containing protein [Thermococcus paralvinellae]|uniref:AbrB/MazE/SpoVT family DNA-binding domain-containing protein n=1 Tax=Thermococcus paralvinellae TaxID=582419 RepID=A0A832ZGT0_9EURY|nr:AbrB/MazE/SpoVT family DNA-binding domain-containing protein [Thermococcus paralvinellae]HIP88656.1 AbrB/MazE/SpoVT family DNA-binding domain-containing protein [Thermococcus paralvinellae]